MVELKAEENIQVYKVKEMNNLANMLTKQYPIYKGKDEASARMWTFNYGMRPVITNWFSLSYYCSHSYYESHSVYKYKFRFIYN